MGSRSSRKETHRRFTKLAIPGVLATRAGPGHDRPIPDSGSGAQLRCFCRRLSRLSFFRQTGEASPAPTVFEKGSVCVPRFGQASVCLARLLLERFV